MAMLTPSSTCAALIKSFEQCRLSAYLPTPDDVPTIGWGTTGMDVRLGQCWTQDQCDARFASDLAAFASSAAGALGSATTAQHQFDALVSIVYNIGLGNFVRSTLLRLHKAGDYAGARAQFAVWNKQNGKVLNGLIRRRAAEAALYGGSA